MSFVLSNYVKSKTLYALDPSTFKMEMVPGYGQGAKPTASFIIDALWTVTKKGATQVCRGTFNYDAHQVDQPVDYNYFLAHAEARYGGNPDCRWDGEHMWAPYTPLTTMVEWSQELDPVLANLPAVPTGFEGWYLLK